MLHFVKHLSQILIFSLLLVEKRNVVEDLDLLLHLLGLGKHKDSVFYVFKSHLSDFIWRSVHFQGIFNWHREKQIEKVLLALVPKFSPSELLAFRF